MIVTIDGPAGTGKSTIAQMVAAKSDLYYLNSGSVYRTFTYAMQGEFGDSLLELLKHQAEKIIDFARQQTISISNASIVLNGDQLTDAQLRNDRIDSMVAQVSAIPEIRDIVNAILVEISKSNDIIAEGRDMSTVVFPHAELKFYFDASAEARAKRRFDQGTSELSLQEIEQSIRQRDAIDKNKKVGALKLSEDATYLDTSDLTIEQVCEIVLESIRDTHKSSGVYR